MRDSIYNFSLDLHEVASQIQITMRQGDTARTLRVQLVEDGKPYVPGRHTHVELSATRPDEEPVLHDADIDLLSGVIIYNMPGNFITGVAGLVECEFILYDETDSVLASPRFTILVSDRAIDPGDITSDDQFTTLQTALAEAEAAKPVVLECKCLDDEDEPCALISAVKLTDWQLDGESITAAIACETARDAYDIGRECVIRCETVSSEATFRIAGANEDGVWFRHNSAPEQDITCWLNDDGTTEFSSDIASLGDFVQDYLHRTVTDEEKTTWNAKYQKPVGGIPSTDMTSAVQTSLGKADTAEQTSRMDTAVTALSTDNGYPSTKAVYTAVKNAADAAEEYTDTKVLNTQTDLADLIALKQNTANIRQVISQNASYEETYPSVKAAYNALAAKMNNPTNTGSTGQVLTKTASGAAWADAQGYDEFEVTATVTALDATPVTNLSKNALEIYTAYNAGKKVVGRFTYQGVTAECPLTSCFQISGAYIATFLCNFYTAASGLNYTLYVVYQQGETDTGYVLPFLGASDIDYSNTTSGLSATNVKTAIDELSAEKIDVPSGGVAGQYLKKTSSGVAWDTPSGGGGGSVFVEVQTDTQIHAATYTDFYGWKVNGENSTESDACLALFNAVKSGTPCSLLIYAAQDVYGNRQLFVPTGNVHEDGGNGGTFATFIADNNTSADLAFNTYSIYVYYYYVDNPGGRTQEEGGIGDVWLKTGLMTSQAEKNTWNNKLSSPSGGSAGQVLTKTASGYAWAALPIWDGTVI